MFFPSQKGKLFALLLTLLSLPACSGLLDWTLAGLPGGYEVRRLNSRTVVLCMPDEKYPSIASNVIDTYVFEIAYDDAFIYVKQGDVPDNIKEPIDTSNPNYYIVDVAEEKCYGPFSESEFDDQCQELGAGGPVEWMEPEDLRDALSEQS